MAITDIVTHIEVASQSSIDSPESSFEAGADRHRSERSGYRRALSRSLNETESRQPSSQAEPPVAVAAEETQFANPNQPDTQVDDLPQREDLQLQDPQSPTDSEEAPVAVDVVIQRTVTQEPLPNTVLPLETSVPAEQPAIDEGVTAQTQFEPPQPLEPTPDVVPPEIVPTRPSSFQVTVETVAPAPGLADEGSASSQLDSQPLPPGGLFRVDQHQASPSVAIEVPITDGEQPAEVPAVQPTQSVEANAQPLEPIPSIVVQPDAIEPATEPTAHRQDIPTTVRPEVAPPVHQRTETAANSAETVAAAVSAEPTASQPQLATTPPESQAIRESTHSATTAFGASTTVVQDVGASQTASTPADLQFTATEGLAPVIGEPGGQVVSDPAVRATEGEAAVRTTELVDRVTEMVRLTQQQNRPLRVRLHPPELGALQVEIVSRDGGVTARLQVESQAAHRAIVESLSLLQDSLSNNGTVVDRIDVQLSPNLQDNRQSGLNRHGEGESGGSERDEQQRGTKQDRRGDQRSSDERGEPDDPEQIDIEI